jgi:hypothetical protein
LLAVGSAAVFSPILRNGFVNWDDAANIARNLWLGRLDPAGLSWPFTATLGGHFQPLAWLSLSLDKAVWGLRPAGFHLTSLLLHAAATAVLFLFLRGLLGNDREADLPAAAAAALFAWHPLRVESVAWATERRDQLFILFLLMAAEAYRRAVGRDARRPRLDMSLLLFVLALMSKVVAAVFPFLLLCLDFGVLRRPLPLKKLVVEKTAFFVCAFAVLALTVRAQYLSGAAAQPWVSAWSDRALVFLWTPGWAVWKSCLPFGLTPFVSPDLAEQRVSFIAVSLFTLVLWSGLIVSFARKRVGLTSLAAAFFLGLSPALGVFRSGVQLSADRFTLLPAAALSVGVAFALKAWGRRASAAALAVALVFGVLADRQCLVWRDSVSLWTRAMDMDPGPVPAMNAVDALLAAHEPARAEELKARVKAEHPESSLALFYSAETPARAGDWTAAEALLARAVAADQFSASMRVAHGVVLYRLNRYPEALGEFDAATARSPENADAWHLLGVADARLGRFVEAEDAVRHALALEADRTDSKELLARLEAARQARPK